MTDDTDAEQFVDELSDADAVAVGILSELTQIRHALERLASEQPDSNNEQDGPRYECVVDGCNERFGDDISAYQHAKAAHNSPNNEAAQRIIEQL